MTITDPRNALAEESSFIAYLVGIAGLSRVVHALANDIERTHVPAREADDFIHALLGVARLGEAIDRLADSAPRQKPCREARSTDSANARWLR